jgi:hypothetical protein
LVTDDPSTIRVMAVARSEHDVHPLDGHPNELAHRIAAEWIVEWLKREELLGP